MTPLSRLDHIQKIFFEKSVQKIQTRTSSFRLWLMLIIDFIEYLFLEPIHEWLTISQFVQIGTHLFRRNSRKTKFLRYNFCTLLAWFFTLSFYLYNTIKPLKRVSYEIQLLACKEIMRSIFICLLCTNTITNVSSFFTSYPINRLAKSSNALRILLLLSTHTLTGIHFLPTIILDIKNLLHL